MFCVRITGWNDHIAGANFRDVSWMSWDASNEQLQRIIFRLNSQRLQHDKSEPGFHSVHFK